MFGGEATHLGLCFEHRKEHQMERSREMMVELGSDVSTITLTAFRPVEGFRRSPQKPRPSTTSFHISVLLYDDLPKLIYRLKYEAAHLNWPECEL